MSTTHSPQSARLRALVDTVLHNERTLRRFQDVELQLIRAQDFQSLCNALFTFLPREFALDGVTLWLNDTLLLLHEIAERLSAGATGNRQLKTAPAVGAAARQLCSRERPWLGTPAGMGHDTAIAFFGDDAKPGSAVILPLVTHGRVSGYLCLASSDVSRFAAGMATDMLERFAVIVAASLDNVAHREQLERLGATDALTNLPNRRYFDERLREETTRAARYKLPIGCLFIDIDRFKPINDTYGHAIGDRALRLVGVCLRKQMRLEDTIARYGGEEFAALLQGDLKDALAVAERIRKAVATIDLFDDAGERIPLTVSIGVAARSTPGGGDPVSFGLALVDEADRAMYKAKSDGRNRVETLFE